MSLLTLTPKYKYGRITVFQMLSMDHWNGYVIGCFILVMDLSGWNFIMHLLPSHTVDPYIAAGSSHLSHFWSLCRLQTAVRWQALRNITDVINVVQEEEGPKSPNLVALMMWRPAPLWVTVTVTVSSVDNHSLLATRKETLYPSTDRTVDAIPFKHFN